VTILAIDTCLGACGVAVGTGDDILAHQCEPMTRGHQERLAPMVQSVMRSAGLAFTDLTSLAVTVGPGSFTGLRVGLAFAEGLALALDVRCAGVDTLTAMAAKVATKTPIAAVIDAGRGRVYLGLYQSGAQIVGPRSLSLESATRLINDTFPAAALTLAGPGAHLLSEAHPFAVTAVSDYPDPRDVLKLAAASPFIPARPLYLREPDAKVKGA